MITVMTPSYNRAHTLGKCYDSLCSQTDKRFTWVIIDDGSQDNTKELVDTWIREKRIDIEYYYKKNGGKASALNYGLDRLNSDYVVCLDSDDYFFPDAIEHAIGELEEIKERTDLCGILAIRHTPDGNVMGGKQIPQEYDTITANDFFTKLQMGKAELVCFYKSEIIKKFRFPVVENENFISPAWMQYKISKEYPYKASWHKYCCCEYLADGLTQNKRKVIAKNPKGYTCIVSVCLEQDQGIVKMLQRAVKYNYGTFLSGDPNWLADAPRKVAVLLTRPLGWLVYLYRRKDDRQYQVQK